MGTPHKHAEIIKAWADGAQIQVEDPYFDGGWRTLSLPAWNVNLQYRVKPEKKSMTIYLVSHQALKKPNISLSPITEVEKSHGWYLVKEVVIEYEE